MSEAETPQGSIVVVVDMGARSPGEEVPRVGVQRTGVGLVLHLDPDKKSKEFDKILVSLHMVYL